MINNKIGVSVTTRKDGRRHWVAEVRVDDKKISKNFASSKYGEEKANLLAIYERLIMEKKYMKFSRDYAETLYDILTEIVDFYGCEIKNEMIDNKKTIVVVGADDEVYKYSHPEEGFIDWCSTLIETDKCCHQEGVEKVWKDEIYFIERLTKL